ncbi:MAG: cellulase [Nevskia sp.]|nr:cellulase [Nevskia sp.]
MVRLWPKLLLATVCAALLGMSTAGAAAGKAAPAKAPAAPAALSWPGWEHFADAFVQDDGRVVEWTAQARTVSEAQAYGLFFALVANDRKRFEHILDWTRENLAQGDLRQHLPSWLWGQDDKSHWNVLDPNSAADADLWLAYDLLEAGRLWQRADYSDTGRAMLKLVAASETVSFKRGTLLLPGPAGFDTPDGPRLNPSYIPPFQFAYFATMDPKGPWRAILDGYLKLLPDIAPSGCVPDWFVLTADGPRKDVASDGRGSYDAVRVYLWAGIGASGTPDDERMRHALKPYVDFIRKANRLPERCFPDGRAPEGLAPAGVEGALLPFYQKLGADDLLQAAQQRIAADTASGLVGQPARYYEQVLNLFGQGWIERRYRLDSSGKLKTQWHD